MTYFTNCQTLNDLKAEYRRLALIHHPDLGGDTATSSSVTARRSAIHPLPFAVIKRAPNSIRLSEKRIACRFFGKQYVF